MRIQETDKILKESRVARNNMGAHHHDEDGMMSRLWKNVSSLPNRMASMFKRGR